MTDTGQQPDHGQHLDPAGIVRRVPAFASFALRRFWWEGGMQAASSLTYTTLLSLVPLLAIAFAIFAAFPAFEGAREQLEATLFDNLVPGVGVDVKAHLNSFLKNTGQLGTVGVVALGLSALLLLSTIEATFNRIWKVDRPRPIVIRFLMYWSVLTLGPLLIGAGITLTTDVFSVARQGLSEAGLDAGGFRLETGGLGDQLLSVVLQTVLFTVLFTVVPNRRIVWRDAVIGGFVSGAGFQLLKIGFTAYLDNVLTYQTIYGAMAVFPIFLIWLYLSWCVVLLGAVFAASCSEWWRGDQGSLADGAAPATVLAHAIRALGVLKCQSRDGGEMSIEALSMAVGSEDIDGILTKMQAGGFVTPSESGGVVLSRDLSVATVHDLYRCLDLTAAGTGDLGDPGFGGGAIGALIRRLGAAERDALGAPLADVIDQLEAPTASAAAQ